MGILDSIRGTNRAAPYSVSKPLKFATPDTTNQAPTYWTGKKVHDANSNKANQSWGTWAYEKAKDVGYRALRVAPLVAAACPHPVTYAASAAGWALEIYEGVKHGESPSYFLYNTLGVLAAGSNVAVAAQQACAYSQPSCCYSPSLDKYIQSGPQSYGYWYDCSNQNYQYGYYYPGCDRFSNVTVRSTGNQQSGCYLPNKLAQDQSCCIPSSSHSGGSVMRGYVYQPQQAAQATYETFQGVSTHTYQYPSSLQPNASCSPWGASTYVPPDVCQLIAPRDICVSYSVRGNDSVTTPSDVYGNCPPGQLDLPGPGYGPNIEQALKNLNRPTDAPTALPTSASTTKTPSQATTGSTGSGSATGSLPTTNTPATSSSASSADVAAGVLGAVTALGTVGGAAYGGKKVYDKAKEIKHRRDLSRQVPPISLRSIEEHIAATERVYETLPNEGAAQLSKVLQNNSAA